MLALAVLVFAILIFVTITVLTYTGTSRYEAVRCQGVAEDPRPVRFDPPAGCMVLDHRSGEIRFQPVRR